MHAIASRGPREPHLLADGREKRCPDPRNAVEPEERPERTLGGAIRDDRPRQPRADPRQPLDLPGRRDIHVYPLAGREGQGMAQYGVPMCQGRPGRLAEQTDATRCIVGLREQEADSVPAQREREQQEHGAVLGWHEAGYR